MKRLFVALLLSVLFASCHTYTPQGKSEVQLVDGANLLSSAVQQQLAELDYYGLPISVQTFEELPIENLNEVCTALFAEQVAWRGADFAQNGVLVVASAKPNLAVAKFGAMMEEWSDGHDHYGSAAYFRTQLDERMTPEEKVVEVLEQAVNAMRGNNRLIGMLRSEFFGNLYTGVVRPDDGFFYRYILYPAQWLFVQLLHLCHSFYWAVFLGAAMLFLLYRLVVRLIIRCGMKRCYAHPDRTKLYMQTVNDLATLSGTLIYLIPMTLGALSLAVSIGLGGVEFLAPMIENSGMPLAAVSAIFQSNLMQHSWGWAMAASLVYYFQAYDPENSWLPLLKNAAFFFVVLLAPSSVPFVLLLLLLPMAWMNFPRFWDNTYKDLRISGNSRLVSTCLALLYPIGAIVGGTLGAYDGLRDAEPFIIERHMLQTASETASAPTYESVVDALNELYAEQK